MIENKIENKRFFTKEDLCEFFNTTRKTLYKILKSNGFPLPICNRWSRVAVEEWVKEKSKNNTQNKEVEKDDEYLG